MVCKLVLLMLRGFVQRGSIYIFLPYAGLFDQSKSEAAETDTQDCRKSEIEDSLDKMHKFFFKMTLSRTENTELKIGS